MKVLVTGGAGFIASHIVDAYVERGHEVFIFDDLSTGQRTNLNPKATFLEVDIADAKAVKLIAQIKPDVLNHHAAQMDVRHSVADPQFDARVNILGFINLLEACKNAGTKKVIFASSGGAVYGEQDIFPAPEEHPTRPSSPYGVSKRTGELYLSYYQQAFGLPYIALRYANVYGPRQSNKGEAGVVAIFISLLLAGKVPVINGDGKQTRDYVYVGDVAAASVAALESPFVGEINIGTGVETDVVTLFQSLRQGAGSKFEASHGPAKIGEQRRSCLAAQRAADIFGWRPQVSLREGLERTIAYYRGNVAS
ncbi:MAG: NAD-dependent epimerase/dehydratase family protein [Deltaproteobacteria bacterium]|nr:NAD-dependent epimerase/dehydratase family protein [Deltaproteobacteria bacterium]MDZ4343627.1 NAD-dependent epimerase/dehydratase family protein [Candidatus Binatia bacterium]